MMAISPTCIVVHELVPVKTLKEFIDYARANPTSCPTARPAPAP